jgi:hypothetical protein
MTDRTLRCGGRWSDSVRLESPTYSPRYHIGDCLRATIFGQARWRCLVWWKKDFSRKGAEAQRNTQRSEQILFAFSLRLCAFARDK